MHLQFIFVKYEYSYFQMQIKAILDQVSPQASCQSNCSTVVLSAVFHSRVYYIDVSAMYRIDFNWPRLGTARFAFSRIKTKAVYVNGGWLSEKLI